MRNFSKKFVFSKEREYPVDDPMTWTVDKNSKEMRAIEVGSPYASPDVDLIVAHAHSLRTLSLFKLKATRIPGLVCHFPRLRHLSLQGNAEEGNGAFLKALSAPALVQLVISSSSKAVDALALHVARLRGPRKLMVSLTDRKAF
jgi:hypothetical protein